MTDKQGKFIVLYGINNLGKTTQAKMLVERLLKHGEKAEYLKYPIYDLSPTGTILNNYIRGNNFLNLTPREAQIIYAKNRAQYEPSLKEKLARGIHVIAEDYTGTGLAWGTGAGINELFLKFINSHLLKEDLAFLFDGERYLEAVEAGHRHENDEELIAKVRGLHERLGEELGWRKINANQPLEEIHRRLWQETADLIKINQPFKRAEEVLIQKTSRVIPIFSADNYTLLPGDTTIIKTGLRIAIPEGAAGFVLGEKNLAKEGLETVGEIIEPSHEEEIELLIKNRGQDIRHISKGEKIAKMIVYFG